MPALPAVLTGAPIFDNRVDIVRPVIPSHRDIEGELKEILTSGLVTKGTYLQNFEADMAAHLQVKHAVAVSSCTSGLMLSLRGLGLTGDVIVPSFTFMATISACIWAGLNPVFADVDLGTTNLDPVAVEQLITPSTSAIVAVHNFGNPAAIEPLQDIANRQGLELIFDAAHGFGSLYKGCPIGGFGDVEVFSLSPTKLIIAGEGGIVATNNGDLADKVRIGREYGMKNYDSLFAGINARLPEFNALMGIYSLKKVGEAVQCRNEIADIYAEKLRDVPGVGFQKVNPSNRCSYKDYSILVDEREFGLTRNELALALAAENIDTRKYYDPPAHTQMAYRAYTPSNRRLPVTEYLANNILCLPIWSNMKDDVCLGIADAIRRVQAHAGAVRKVLNRRDVLIES